MRPTLNFEKLFWQSGCKFVAGVDEAGVAPLAGPVVAAAVILKPGTNLREIPKITDSKLLKPVERQKLYTLIKKVCIDYSVGISEVQEIDFLNIRQATFLAMRRSLEQLKKIDAALIDGPFTPRQKEVLQIAVVNGDAKIASISAASIIAKVTRDLIMTELAEKFPQYGFEKHKGYPTKFHINKLLEFGPTSVHRKSFLNNFWKGA